MSVESTSMARAQSAPADLEDTDIAGLSRESFVEPLGLDDEQELAGGWNFENYYYSSELF